MTEEELKAMIDEFDTDGDGEISQEVCACIVYNPLLIYKFLSVSESNFIHNIRQDFLASMTGDF